MATLSTAFSHAKLGTAFGLIGGYKEIRRGQVRLRPLKSYYIILWKPHLAAAKPRDRFGVIIDTLTRYDS